MTKLQNMTRPDSVQYLVANTLVLLKNTYSTKAQLGEREFLQGKPS